MVEDDEAVEDEEDASEETAEPKKPVVGPVTIWIGVFPESTSATAAHNAAQDVLALLEDYKITDVDVDFRESYYRREAGPQLLEPVDELHPLVNVISPLTPTLGLRISTRARPGAQGTMALYLAEGGSSNNLLGLTCRHVLIGPKEANIDYICHPSRPSKDVLLLGRRAFNDLVDSIRLTIGNYGMSVKRRRKRVAEFEEREKGTDAVDVEMAKANRIETERLMGVTEKAMVELGKLLDQVNKHWKKLDDRVLGHILRSPAISLGVGDHGFTEDWGIFQVNRAKLGDGFKGNMIDLGAF